MVANGKKGDASIAVDVLYGLYVAAICGLVGSAVLHLVTFFGVDPQRYFPVVGVFTMLLFPPFIAGIFRIRAVQFPPRVPGEPRKVNAQGALAYIADAPTKLKVATFCLFFYGWLNYLVCWIVLFAMPPKEKGPWEVHMASGIWMFFYSLSAMMLYPRKKPPPTSR